VITVPTAIRPNEIRLGIATIVLLPVLSDLRAATVTEPTASAVIAQASTGHEPIVDNVFIIVLLSGFRQASAVLGLVKTACVH